MVTFSLVNFCYLAMGIVAHHWNAFFKKPFILALIFCLLMKITLAHNTS